jgi:2'-5' RNA ligase
MHRLFVAIRPPEPIRDQLIDLMDDGIDIHWQSDEQLHLTLRFIGEVERPVANDVAAALQRVRFDRLPIALDGVGTFDHRRHGALWAGVRPKDQLKLLAAKIERACQSAGIEPEHRAYRPHITLARWSGGAPSLDRFLDRNAGLSSQMWEVDDFALFESRLGKDGACYEKVASYGLTLRA